MHVNIVSWVAVCGFQSTDKLAYYCTVGCQIQLYVCKLNSKSTRLAEWLTILSFVVKAKLMWYIILKTSSVSILYGTVFMILF